MKTQINLNELSKQELKDLTVIVKETVATNAQLKDSKPFNAADLWNIQRKTKTAFLKRQYL